MYIENPKTKNSGIICCIPQTGECPMHCPDCFFQSGKSYLEPLDKNLPNMPSITDAIAHVVRVNDGNDSSNDIDLVLRATEHYPFRFYNTSKPYDIDKFKEPVVLTLNPNQMTDKGVWDLGTGLSPLSKNIMFFRIRTNTWNTHLIDKAIALYPDTAIVLTFMAYHDINSIPSDHWQNYIVRKRTMNEYYAITTEAWRNIMKKYEDNLLIYSCGKIEGEKGKTGCKYCGNCLREYFATKERIIKQ